MTAVNRAWPRFRDDLQAQLFASLPGHVARMTWNREQIAQDQSEGLRVLLQTAAEIPPSTDDDLQASTSKRLTHKTCRR
jgi:hypothetical protein